MPNENVTPAERKALRTAATIELRKMQNRFIKNQNGSNFMHTVALMLRLQAIAKHDDAGRSNIGKTDSDLYDEHIRTEAELMDHDRQVAARKTAL